MSRKALPLFLLLAAPVVAEDRQVYLESHDGTRRQIASIDLDGTSYPVEMAAAPFTDHFLSMRPF